MHHVVAALAEAGDDRLVFKGGTLLRVCVFEDYRWSEDLDFDWAGSPQQLRALVDAAAGVTQLPEPVSPSYRNRVPEVSHTYRSQRVKHHPGQHMLPPASAAADSDNRNNIQNQ